MEASRLEGDAVAFALGGSGGLWRRSSGALGTWAGLAVIGLLIALPLRGLYVFTGGTMEEGFMLYFPERVALGDVPNVDFLHLYGPGSLQALFGWFEVFGYSLRAERTFGLIQHLGIILGLFALARPWGRLVATFVGALAVFYVLTPVALTAMAWNGGLALTLWGTVFAVRGIYLEGAGRGYAWLAAGALYGLALTFRPDLIVAIGLVVGWMIWRYRPIWRALAIGGAVGLIPMWVHLAMAGPGPAIRGMLLDPVFELRAGRELPRPPSWSSLDGSLQVIAETVPPFWPFPSLSASHTLFFWFWLMLLTPFGLLGVAVWRRRRSGPTGPSTALLVTALVSIGVLPQGLQRPDSAHLLWVTCVSFPFVVVAVVELVGHRRPALSARRVVLIGGAAALALTFVFTSLFTFRYWLLHVRVGLEQVNTPFLVRRDDRVFYLGDYRAHLAVQAAVDEVDRRAAPGDRLLVGPSDLSRTWYSDVFIYWFFPELEPATYYIEMDPGLANAEGSSLADDVASADFVLLTGLWDGWTEPNTSAEHGSQAPNEVIAEQFCEIGRWEDGLAMLYERCDRLG
ncbi:MAG: hypothetical protein ACK5OX_00725 [Desertimonas sp.]